MSSADRSKAGGKVKAASAGRTSGGDGSGSPTLGAPRDALRDPLGPDEAAQRDLVLRQEGLGTLAEAREDPEGRLDVVDILVDGIPRLRLFYWPFGSAALFDASGRAPVGAAAQHALTAEDPTKLELVRAAWAQAPARGIDLRLEFSAPSAPRVPTHPDPASPPARPRRNAGAKGATAAATSALKAARAVAIPAFPEPLPDWLEAARGFRDTGDNARLRQLQERFLPAGWAVYPKRLPEEFSSAQRDLLLVLNPSATHLGLFAQEEHYQRFFGLLPPGPGDQRIEMDQRAVPAWWALSSACAGQLDPTAVRDALVALGAASAIPILEEVARGGAYDLLEAHPLSMKDWGFHAKPYQVRYRLALADLLSAVAAALGPPGRRLGEALLTSLPSFGGAAQVLIGLDICARTGGIDPALDLSWAGMGRRLKQQPFPCDPLVRRITEALPPDRRTSLQAALSA